MRETLHVFALRRPTLNTAKMLVFLRYISGLDLPDEEQSAADILRAAWRDAGDALVFAMREYPLEQAARDAKARTTAA